MATYYADSSVLVKRHVQESGAAWIRERFDTQGTLVVTAHVSRVEVTGAFNRRVREGTISQSQYQAVMSDFDQVCGTDYTLIDTTGPVIERAIQLVAAHPLRAYDAIQLATALIVNQAMMQSTMAPLTFLCADERLNAVAEAEGLSVINPTGQT